ncbi:MAG: hypothetical protein EZS28_006580 [Streblomastix strix]|uniref:Uncharacterized protein n=1 Tax=Streblomastix strix TaxID=222440 RepID=A0A5J4WSV3_9EUKA|nr:MAG: hypothetical protein EZS28_006580 [Streblomastix strix]
MINRNEQMSTHNKILDRFIRIDKENNKKKYFMTKGGRHQLIDYANQVIKNTQRHKVIYIKETAAQIGKLYFQISQYRKTSLYPNQKNSAKTGTVKTQYCTGIIVSPQQAPKELYLWIRKLSKIINNGKQIQFHKKQQKLPPYRKSGGLHQNSIQQNFQKLKDHGQEIQITNLLIRSDNSIVIFIQRGLRATDTLAPAVKDIYLNCQHLSMKIKIQHVPVKINITADGFVDYIDLDTFIFNQSIQFKFWLCETSNRLSTFSHPKQ